MASAWHTPHDPREYSEAPVTLPCATCGRDVQVAAEDWRDDGEPHYCVRCIAETVAAPHPVADWPTHRVDLWF